MESLRNFLTGPRLFIVIAACALPFVFLGTSSLGSTFQPTFGSINGEDITQEDLQIANNIALQKFRNIYGDDFNLDDLDESIQLEAIKQELINQKVLLSKARKLGFMNAETEKQAKKSIISNPAFHSGGVFDENIYEAQANAAGYTKDAYLEIMTDIMASELYRVSLASSGFITKKEVKELAYLLEQTADIDFLKIDTQKLKQQIDNPNEEIFEFYNNNQIMFFSEEQRSFKYLILRAEDYENLVEVPENYVEDAYNNYLMKIDNSKDIRFAHIMIDKVNYDSNASAFDAMLKIVNKINSGENFEDLAKKYSEDVVTKDIGGDLEYFDADVFPEQFAEAIKDLGLDDISDVIELEDTLHILKVTEVVENEVMTLEEIKNNLIQELVETESIALMTDDYEIIDEMIFSNNESIESIASSISKNIFEMTDQKLSNFNFEISDQRIKDFVFSPNTNINAPAIFNFENAVVLVSLSSINEPYLQSFNDVKDLASEYLTDKKVSEKKSLLASELALAKEENTLNSFIQAYDFISNESFVDVKRYSSLLPQDVIAEIFKLESKTSKILNSRNGDIYLVDLIKFNQPDEDAINDLYEQYSAFSEEKVSNNISAVIEEDIFQSARINLNNLAF
jgi:peptidyl-prolyl cis-trans isomerase D